MPQKISLTFSFHFESQYYKITWLEVESKFLVTIQRIGCYYDLSLLLITNVNYKTFINHENILNNITLWVLWLRIHLNDLCFF